MNWSPSEAGSGGSFRRLKQALEPLLREAPPEVLRAAVTRIAPQRAVNPLISFFYHPEPMVRWRAVSAFGIVTAGLAQERIEAARVVMRRLMWHLNDESGGIGWGAPEAMGETLARSPQLAAEYHRILVSYVRKDGNFLEHPILQRGALWAAARLAEAHPALAAGAAPALANFMTSSDAHHRGLAVWAAGLIADRGMIAGIEKLRGDKDCIDLYRRWHLERIKVADLAAEALTRLGPQQGSFCVAADGHTP